LSFFEEFLDFMPDEVILHFQVWNQAGDLVDDTNETAACYIEGGAEKVVDENGTEVTSTARIYLATVSRIDAKTKVTLPVGHLPRLKLPIINVMRMSDEDGPSHMVIAV
jgi:hypothetical protein